MILWAKNGLTGFSPSRRAHIAELLHFQDALEEAGKK